MDTIARTATADAPYAYLVIAVTSRRMRSESTAYAASAQELAEAYIAMGYVRVDVAPAVPVNGYREGLPVRNGDVVAIDTSKPVEESRSSDARPGVCRYCRSTTSLSGEVAVCPSCAAFRNVEVLTIRADEVRVGDRVIDANLDAEPFAVAHAMTTGKKSPTTSLARVADPAPRHYGADTILTVERPAIR